VDTGVGLDGEPEVQISGQSSFPAAINVAATPRSPMTAVTTIPTTQRDALSPATASS
jgi:hypothetical protein